MLSPGIFCPWKPFVSASLLSFKNTTRVWKSNCGVTKGTGGRTRVSEDHKTVLDRPTGQSSVLKPSYPEFRGTFIRRHSPWVGRDYWCAKSVSFTWKCEVWRNPRHSIWDSTYHDSNKSGSSMHFAFRYIYHSLGVPRQDEGGGTSECYVATWLVGGCQLYSLLYILWLDALLVFCNSFSKILLTYYM